MEKYLNKYMQFKSKPIYLILCMMVTLYACQEKHTSPLYLSIKLADYTDTTGVYIDELKAGYIAFDTGKYEGKGLFKFYKPIEKAAFFRLRLANGQTMPLILSPNQTTVIEASADSLCLLPKIKGNSDLEVMLKSHQISGAFLNDLKKILSVFNDTTRTKPQQKEKDSLVALTDTLFKKHKTELLHLLNNNKNSLAALPILMQKSGNRVFFNPTTDRQLFIELDNILIRNFGHLTQVKRFHYKLDSAFAVIDSLPGVRLGEKLNETEARSLWKEPLPLSRFMGRPVLVFIWNSTDDECEKEIPVIKQLWETYHPKGLEVYMVSVDSTETIWQSAIEQHRLACFHVNDLKGTKSGIYSQWGIRSLPGSFLVNRQGLVVEKNIWGEPLEQAITRLLEN